MSASTPPPHDSGRPRFAHRPGLDGLRSISVMVVVAFHTGVLAGGWVGVDLFFALSGWLISGILIDEIAQRGSVDLGAFWRRRIRRLLPAVGVLLAVVLVMRLAGWIELRQRGLIGAITYSTNWLNITGGGGYWDQFADPDPLEHLWSLAVEEQIYLIWPLVMFVLVARRGRGRAVRIAGLVIAALSAGAAVHGSQAGWSIDRLYQGTDTRAFAFAIGAAAAGLSLRRLGNAANHLIVVGAMVGIVWIGWDGAVQPSVFRGPMQAISLLGLIAVVAAAGVTAGPLCWSVPRRIGVWSYGIYLFHWPVALALEGRVSDPVWFLLVSAISIALAAASYALVEQRVRRDGLPGRRLVVASLAATAVVAGSLSLTSPVVPAGAQPEVTLPSLLPRPSTDDTTTTQPAGGEPATPTTVLPPLERVLIVGDSVPALAATELVAAGAERGLQVGVLAAPGCVASPHPDDQYDKGECGPFIAGLGAAIDEADPDAIVLWWGGTGEGVSWRGVPTTTCTTEGTAAITGRLDWLLELASPTPTTLVAPVPRTDLDAKAAAGTVCEVAVYDDVAQQTSTPLLRLDQLVCPSFDGDCDRVPRSDGLHYTTQGALDVGDWIFEQLQRQDDQRRSAALAAQEAVEAGGNSPSGPGGDEFDPDSVNRLLVLGDSTADVLAKGLAATGRFEVVNASVWGCPFVEAAAVGFEIGRNRKTDYCPSVADRREWIDIWEPDAILVVHGPSGLWDQRYESSKWRSPGDEVWVTRHDSTMAELVEEAGELPILVVVAPQATPPNQTALETPSRLRAWNAQIAKWDDTFSSVASLDIEQYLPQPGSARDRNVRPDGVHVTDEVMAELAEDFLIDDVLAAARRVHDALAGR
jgi:peptidoglycan/LPS O-acetylase OafA/YrhL